MVKNEHAIFIDIPYGGKKGKFHSAILTTYAIDLTYFDCHVINMLHRKQICSVNVFADYKQMVKTMEYVNPLFMNNIGKEYSVTSMDCYGAFHPKINLFIGDEAVLVVFGSGNLTVTGHGKNHETFTGFMVDETNDTHRPLIEECWRYITQFTNQCSPFECNRILHELPENCIFLDSSYKIEPHKLWDVQKGLKAALLYNDNTSILMQLSKIVPFDEVSKITIASPFFDERGETLIMMSELCPKAEINVLIHENCSLPPCRMPENKRITFYNFSETVRGKSNFKMYDRQLHAKNFHFKTTDAEYCVIGSANATIAGLGTMKQRGVNEEFGVLYVSEKDFLNELGLKIKKKFKINLKDLRYSNSDKKERKHSKYKILFAQYENGKLTVACDKVVPYSQLVVDYGNAIDLYEVKSDDNCTCLVECKIGKNIATCYFVDSDKNCISNKVFINRIAMLEVTNPSQTSRSINRFISLIDDNGYDGLEMASMLTEIMWSLIDNTDENLRDRMTLASNSKARNENTLPHVKYNSKYDNDNVSSKHLMIDKSSLLIECIEESIKRKIRSINETLTNEEECGSAETSNERDFEENQEIIIKRNQIKTFADLSNSVLNGYINLVNKRIEQAKSTGINIISIDDLNFFSLSIFATIEICYLNRPRYQFEGMDSIIQSNSQKQFYEALDRSIDFDCVEAFENFVRFCNLMQKPSDIDEGYKKDEYRVVKYVILLGTLFFKYSNQKERKIFGSKILRLTSQLIAMFGLPSSELFKDELALLSERYGGVFRVFHVERFIKQIQE